MIVHIIKNSKFIGPFITFIKDNFDIKEHLFLIVGESGECEQLPKYKEIKYFSAPMRGQYIDFSKEIKPYFKQSDKIILHGLFIPNLVFFLFFNRKFLQRCYWIIYGGDLYYYQFNSHRAFGKILEFFRKPVIKGLGNIIMYAQGDFKLSEKWYATKAKFHECLYYPYLGVNDYLKDIKLENVKKDTITIMLGNSAADSNNHIVSLLKIKEEVGDTDIKIICPLSYGGSKEYVKKVVAEGNKLFGT